MRPDDRPAPTLEGVLRDLMGSELGDLHVGLPARVESFDSGKGTCDARPVLRHRVGRGEDETAERLPVLRDVPVLYPRGGGFLLSWPLQAGDYVWLTFADATLDEWARQGGSDVTPSATRQHDLADAVAYAGLGAPGGAGAASSTDMVFGVAPAASGSPPGRCFRVGPAGMRVGDETDDFLAAMYDALTVLQTVPAVLVAGVVNPAYAAALALLQAQVANLSALR